MPCNIWQQWHCHSPHQSTAYYIGSRKCPPQQACHIRHSLQSEICHRWPKPCRYALDRPCSTTSRLMMPLRTSCGPVPQVALPALGGVAADTTSADNKGVFAGFLEDTQAKTRDKELGRIYADTELFTFHASLLCLELGNTLLPGVCDEHQVINIDTSPRQTRANIIW